MWLRSFWDLLALMTRGYSLVLSHKLCIASSSYCLLLGKCRPNLSLLPCDLFYNSFFSVTLNWQIEEVICTARGAIMIGEADFPHKHHFYLLACDSKCGTVHRVLTNLCNNCSDNWHGVIPEKSVLPGVVAVLSHSAPASGSKWLWVTLAKLGDWFEFPSQLFSA